MHGRQPALTLRQFTARLGGAVRVEPLLSSTSLISHIQEVPVARAAPGVLVGSEAAESPIAVLTAEIALLHARMDDLQARLDK